MSVIDKIKLDGTTYDVGKTPDTTLAVSGSPADAAKVGTELDKKVDKITGKGLSTEDYTTAEKTKLAGLTQIEVDDTLSVEGRAADAKAVGDRINLIATFDSSQDEEIVYHKSDLQSTYDSTYVNEGSISDTGRFSATTSYRTYYMQATEDMNVWLEKSLSSNSYLSIAVYNDVISASAFVARYRNTDSNIPTETNRLSIANGQWLAITIGYSSQEDRDFNLYTGLYNPVSTDPAPTNEFMSAINARIDKSVGVATKTATSLTVVIGGKIKYEVNKYSNSTIRAYMWRTNACYVLDANDVWQTVWKDSDSDGVVKISGEADFLGGYHGDETQTLFKLFVDGTEYADTDTFEDVKFNEITLFAYSDVYHCNTSATPDVVAFKRSKIIKFNKDGYTVENKWTAQEDLTLEIAYIGMLSVQKTLIQAYTNNSNYYCYTSLNGINRLSDMTEAEFVLPYGTIGIAVSNYTQPTTYSGVISAYTDRLKAYLSTINSSSHGAIANGGVIRGKAVTYFKG